ncbi:fimbria/pilus periplasmic chaperone [Burkholderia ubonensis]|uniref:fimbria/pilus periplasmic chaperone n=1 Tax=Burkholderia ubonensis TaxID=101571 RepID=UPI0007573342|nr:fimbria/pilus periplasmic chaperone [Burkholderia ubonensis]KVX74474.1 hypothetical protein WL08_17695 [Burkholderia ubonensis]
MYPEDRREVSVRLTNDDAQPVLVQAWLDTGDPKADPSVLEVPFTVNPPVFRMDPKRGQTLRLAYTKVPLPGDRESVFWLNVLEVPTKAAASDGNTLQFAFRTRLKVFFRPKGLAGSAAQAPAQIHWALVPLSDERAGYGLQATNRTPYAVSFSKVSLKAGNQTWDTDGTMVMPDGSEVFPVKAMQARPSGPVQIEYSTVNDYGAIVDDKAALP